jgi:hypothetical protein
MKVSRLVVLVICCVELYAAGQQIGSNTSAASTSTPATVPRLVQFSGVAKDIDGKPLTGTVGITFFLYRDQQGGAPLWMEVQNVQVDARGHYSAQLGANTQDGLPTDDFTSGEARWLGIQIAGQTEQPRVLLLAVPYALKAADASTVGGLPPSAFVRANPEIQAATGQSQSPSGSSSSAAATAGPKAPLAPLTLLNVQTASPGQTAGFVPLWIGKSPTAQLASSALFQSSGKIGIGTTSPAATLDIHGNLNLPRTTGATAGVISLGGAPFMHAFFSGHGTPDNTFLGFGAGNFTMTGPNNTALGQDALHANTSGSSNTAVGVSALLSNTQGINNTAIGESAMFGSTTGSQNTAVGLSAMGGALSGHDNTAVGMDALGFDGFTGAFNTAVGESSLGVTTGGSFNTGIGYVAGPAQTGINQGNHNNTTAIGAFAQVGADNSMVLGSINGVNGANANTHVGIGTTVPNTTLHVIGNDTYQPLRVESPNTFGTWIQLANTSAGGLTWYMLSAASGNSEGAGNLALVNSNFNGSGTVFIHSNLQVDGTVSKGGGSFRIDHPLDAANKYLSHSFVESPDMMNIYNGNVVTNKQGLAVVVLPDYFEALNRDFRYQLTPIGQFAQAIVAREINHGRFTIKTSRPGVKVSWQVTGIRHDAYADAHRIQVEEEKPIQERGKYLHPELFAASQEKAIGYSSPPHSAMAIPDQVASTVSRPIIDANSQ